MPFIHFDAALASIAARVHSRVQSSRSPASATPESRVPFVLGISGLQGSGKSYWASQIAGILGKQYKLKTIVVSLDDFYHTHETLVRIREANLTNGLLQTRGQPGTHDEELILEFFNSFADGREYIQIPSFDKSQFDGKGDRVPREDWETISAEQKIDVVIFEGWCIGFQNCSNDAIKAMWTAAMASRSLRDICGMSVNTLGDHTLDDLLLINENLRRYNSTFMRPSEFDYMVLLDTDDLANVYKWRIDQEHALRARTGKGMSDEQVIRFVRGYMPAYECYLSRLQEEPFIAQPWAGKVEHIWDSTSSLQVKVTLAMDRSIQSIQDM